jgi:DNA-binding protein H-NS
MANELREYEIELRKEGEMKARKKIARKMKSLGIFSNGFIAELVELDIKTIERIKANDEQRETRTS